MVVMDRGRVLHQGPCADAQTHRAIEAVFDQRIRIVALQDQWVVLPK
jgi:iron complex transport system ATP-binding protein